MVVIIGGPRYRKRGHGSDGQQYENHNGAYHEVLVAVIMVGVGYLISLGNTMASNH